MSFPKYWRQFLVHQLGLVLAQLINGTECGLFHVLTVVTPGFKISSKKYQSFTLLHSVSVLNEHIKKKKVFAHRSFVLGIFFVYYFQIMFHSLKADKIRTIGIHIFGIWSVNFIRCNHFSLLCVTKYKIFICASLSAWDNYGKCFSQARLVDSIKDTFLIFSFKFVPHLLLLLLYYGFSVAYP